jgi:hypothetical protein
VSPVKYEMEFYIPEDDILIAAVVKTSNLTTAGKVNSLSLCNKVARH